MNEKYLLELIPQIRTNYSEIYFHPQSTLEDAEFDALCSIKVKDLLQANNFQLVNYKQIKEQLS